MPNATPIPLSFCSVCYHLHQPHDHMTNTHVTNVGCMQLCLIACELMQLLMEKIVPRSRTLQERKVSQQLTFFFLVDGCLEETFC